jgi:hypothetical protein
VNQHWPPAHWPTAHDVDESHIVGARVTAGAVAHVDVAVGPVRQRCNRVSQTLGDVQLRFAVHAPSVPTIEQKRSHAQPPACVEQFGVTVLTAVPLHVHVSQLNGRSKSSLGWHVDTDDDPGTSVQVP